MIQLKQWTVNIELTLNAHDLVEVKEEVENAIKVQPFLDALGVEKYEIKKIDLATK